jgi:AAA domain
VNALTPIDETNATVTSSPIAPLVPNRIDIAAHLHALFGPAFVHPYPESWIEIAYGWPASGNHITDAQNFSAFDLDRAVEFAEARNKAGWNLYVGPALRQGKQPGDGRADKTLVVTSSHAWAEYDGAGDDKRIDGILKANNLSPNLIITTGSSPHPRRHLYFGLEGNPSRDQLQAINTSLKTLLGSDDVQDPARIMRLAGTINYPTPDKIERGYVDELVTLQAMPAARSSKIAALIALAPGTGATSDDPIAVYGMEARKDQSEIRTLLETVGGKDKWHDPMLAATGKMIGHGWSDFQIKMVCAPYCKGGFDDPDLLPLIDEARVKWNKPDPGEAPIDRKRAPAPIPIHATPYSWIDPTTIPQREWVYGDLLIRKIVSATISPGGTGKSSLVAVEALAMVSGQPLLGVSPPELLRVWLWNLEDPQEETERKVQAGAKFYGLKPSDIGDRLLVDSGRDQKLVIATTTRDGAVIVQPVVDSLVAEIIARKIDVLIIDPFVSCHEVAENDNPAMDKVVKEWGRVAGKGNCAVHLVHHTRKMGDAAEVTTESSRGGSSQTDACRVVRTVNRMTKQEATNAGIENPRAFFRTYNDKANFAPPVEKSDWFELVGVDLGNGPMGMPGDSVGVVTEWDWPDMTAGMTAGDYDKVVAEVSGGKWKESVQAKNWAGIAIAEALGLDLDVPTDKAKVKAALRMYLNAGTLVVVERHDEDQRKLRKFVEVP